MGSCFGRCCPTFKIKRRGGRAMFYDRGSILEFESLMDESPTRMEPVSVVTERERNLVAFKRYDDLVAEQEIINDAIQKEHAKKEEELELEEEAFIEARREASRVARLATSQQIINPARLVFRDSAASLPDDEYGCVNGSMADDDLEVFIDESKLRLLTSRTYLPSHSSMLETGSTVSSVCGKEWVTTNGSTPPSSIDLEWDEAGVFASADKNSTPASNDLEWDNDFENQQSAQLDMETEHLISEIEKLTWNVLEETNHDNR